MVDVAVVPAAEGPDPSVADLLAAWLPGRRWYPGGTGDVRAEPWLAVTFDDDGGTVGADVLVLLVRLTGPTLPGGEVVVQVPLVLTDADAPGPGYIGTVATPSGDVAVHDGAAHPACWIALLHSMGIGTDDVEGDAAALTRRGRVLAGEQSNTSVILPEVPSPGGSGGMLKILRTVAPGQHPDVVVPQALTEAGWDGVPRFLGALKIATPDDATVHLAILAELVPDAEDGFELACDVASRGESFAPLAADLGRVVAEMHAVLRRALPEGPPVDPRAFVAGLRRRAAAAVGEAPALAAREAEITALLDDLERRLVAAPSPVATQTIHGDLHLGQALHGATGWKILDFEGEPQRPVAERTAPDLPLRDVAGMLRSFGYAAAVGRAPDPAWETEAADAFLAAYRETVASGLEPDTDAAALTALVLDKALYEVVYETRQRPTWVGIPLAAVDRALGAVS
ncbi:maltokinase N-terminal cap-like domain-containing protein [Isoptericola variabilis]|uniref:Maltokinase n=1 Tax=Isoptericola variabilis (strain 225) TaxID=743718 RepID=F6FR15_ISOV2|nr:phosphotransferase [Isoptericola variabilis]AEG44965.1 aminoglycoside phosphotransferase [Isoptericola variabilis 225]TWH26023.1 maltokinase [Isoptericola variabilis J7]